jgi:hypothetical protein
VEGRRKLEAKGRSREIKLGILGSSRRIFAVRNRQ